MENPATGAETLNIEELLHLHDVTKDVSTFCQNQLRGYLGTMTLLFRSRRILGEAMEGVERESSRGSDRTIAELRELYHAVRPFVLRAFLMLFQFAKFPAIADLLGGLRYRVEVRRSPETGELPLVTISASVGTNRPPDKLVTLASGMAGGTNFAEVLDLVSLQILKDPIREQMAAIFRGHGQEL
jgi:hypothetical protein